MTAENIAEKLAMTWIEQWNKGEPDDIPLTDSSTHTSPFGRLAGRDFYLETVKPKSKQNVTSLKILRTLGRANQAVIHFEMETQKETIHCCDWITVEDDKISEIHSFYDATALRS